MPFFSTFSDSFKAGERPATVVNIQSIPNLQIWYDASTPSQFQPSNPVNGASLSNWNDKSAFAHNASPVGGANKPTYATPIQNGYGAVQFDGISQNFQINLTTWAASLPGFTIYMVLRPTSTTGTRAASYSDTNGMANYITNGVWVTQTAGGTGTSTVAADTSKFHIIGQIFDGTQTGNDNRLKFRYDLTPQPLTWNGTTVGTTTNSSVSKINFGWTGTGGYWQGYIAEVIMLTRAATALDVSAIETFLKTKWAL